MLYFFIVVWVIGAAVAFWATAQQGKKDFDVWDGGTYFIVGAGGLVAIFLWPLLAVILALGWLARKITK